MWALLAQRAGSSLGHSRLLEAHGLTFVHAPGPESGQSCSGECVDSSRRRHWDSNSLCGEAVGSGNGCVVFFYGKRNKFSLGS